MDDMRAANGRLEGARRRVEEQYSRTSRCARPTTRAASSSMWPTSSRTSAAPAPEDEEEIGSGDLGPFRERYRPTMSADAVVLSDTSNFEVGVSGLTYTLRGLCQVDVVRTPRTRASTLATGGNACGPQCTSRMNLSVSDPGDARA
jgi:hypothetical protein